MWSTKIRKIGFNVDFDGCEDLVFARFCGLRAYKSRTRLKAPHYFLRKKIPYKIKAI